MPPPVGADVAYFFVATSHAIQRQAKAHCFLCKCPRQCKICVRQISTPIATRMAQKNAMSPDVNTVDTQSRPHSGGVLVVDDDTTLREMFATLLQSDGLDVVRCNSGADAIQHLSRRTFDLVVLDLWLPDISGLEVLAHFRGVSGNVKFLIMTADSTPESLIRALKEQAYQYVHKPVSGQDFVELVRTAIVAPPPYPIEVLSARPEWLEFEISSTPEEVHRLGSFMHYLHGDLDPELSDSLSQALQELMLNAVEWGGQCDPRRKVRIAFVRTKRMLQYRIADPGAGFQFPGLAHSAVSNPASNPVEHAKVREERGLRPGGLGLMMVRSIADELLFNETQNEVLFVKYLS